MSPCESGPPFSKVRRQVRDVRVIGAITVKKILRSFLSCKHSIVQTQLNGVMSEVSVHVFLPISVVADRFSTSDNIGYYLGRKSK